MGRPPMKPRQLLDRGLFAKVTVTFVPAEDEAET